MIAMILELKKKGGYLRTCHKETEQHFPVRRPSSETLLQMGEAVYEKRF